jgi:TRAP-type C4-dicarboxylate transport system permease small subunit
MTSHWRAQLSGALAAAALFGIMTLTFVGVIARYFLGQPIIGDDEVQACLLGIIVFSALPLVTAAQKHIAVKSFAGLLKGRPLFVQKLAVLLMTGLGFSFVAYLIVVQGLELQENGTLSTYLDIPEAPLAYVFAALTAIAAGTAFIRVYLLLRGRDPGAPAGG